MPGTTREATGNGLMGAAISNSMVGLLHQYTGRGPTRARTTIGEDLIVCVMGATLTKGEKTLADAGKSDLVLEGRRAFQDAFQADAIAAVQEISHRRVVAFMSNNHIDPDLAVEVFVLEPASDDVRDGHGVEHGDGVAELGFDGNGDVPRRSDGAE